MSSGASLPDELEEGVRTYLGAFLPAAAVDEALRGIREDLDYWGDDGTVAVFTAAHAELDSRLRIATDVETLVLHDDVGLPVADVAEILEIPPDDLRRMLRDALIELGEVGSDSSPSPPRSEPAGAEAPSTAAPSVDEESGPLRSLVAALVGLVLLGAIVIAVVVSAGGPSACRDAADVRVTRGVVTDAIGPDGAPAAQRDTFDEGDSVYLWVSFEERARSGQSHTVHWARSGVELYETDLQLPSGGQVNVALAPTYATPGTYTVQLRQDRCVLVEERFEIGG